MSNIFSDEFKRDNVNAVNFLLRSFAASANRENWFGYLLRMNKLNFIFLQSSLGQVKLDLASPVGLLKLMLD